MPRFFIDEKLAIVPKTWQLDLSEKITWIVIVLGMKNPSYWKKTPLGYPRRKNVFYVKKGEIETYRAHRILIKQSNFKSLANEILLSKEDLPQSVSENMRHENRR